MFTFGFRFLINWGIIECILSDRYEYPDCKKDTHLVDQKGRKGGYGMPRVPWEGCITELINVACNWISFFILVVLIVMIILKIVFLLFMSFDLHVNNLDNHRATTGSGPIENSYTI